MRCQRRDDIVVALTVTESASQQADVQVQRLTHESDGFSRTRTLQRHLKPSFGSQRVPREDAWQRVSVGGWHV